MEVMDQEFQKRINKKVTKLTNVVCELHVQNIDATQNLERLLFECGSVYER